MINSKTTHSRPDISTAQHVKKSHRKQLLNAASLCLLTLPFLIQPSAHASMWSEGKCSDTQQEGATNKFYNRAAGFRWQNFLGDWRDANNIKQGPTPYATLAIEDLDKIQNFSVDLTPMVKMWVDNQASNQGVLIRNTMQSKVFLISKEHEQAELAATLEVTTSEGTVYLKPTADTYLRHDSYTCQGNAVKLSIRDNAHTLIHFDLANVKDVSNAKLSFSTTESQYGDAVIEFYRVAIESKHYDKSLLSRKYPNDYLMTDDANLIMSESFEDENWAQNWSFASPTKNLSIVDSNEAEKFSPLMGKALQIHLPQGELNAMNVGYVFNEKIGKDLDEVYFRYYLRLSDSWQTTLGGKLPGIAGTYHNTSNAGGWGGRRSNGENGWSVRGYFKVPLSKENLHSNRVPIGNYIYHADQQSTWGAEITYDGQNPGLLERNRWYSIEQYVKVNTPGKNDGIVKAWIDGEPAFELDNLKFRNEGFEHIAIDRVWMNIYHGGKEANNQDIYAFIDNVVIATQAIGPISFDANLPTAGNEPNRAPIIVNTQPSAQTLTLQVNTNTEFSINVIEPDRENVEINWLINGEIVQTGGESFTLATSLVDDENQIIAAQVSDPHGELTTHQWQASIDQSKIHRMPLLEDTTLFSYYSTSQGQSTKLDIGSRNETTLLRFNNTAEISPTAISSAKLIMYDIEQYGGIELSVYKGDDRWFEGSDSSSGSTGKYIDVATRELWPTFMGSWFDVNGIEFGLAPYQVISIEDTNKPRFIEIDVTDYVLDNFNDPAFNLVLKTQVGKHRFASKEGANPQQAPKLIILLD